MTGRAPRGVEREVVVDGQPARVFFDLLNAPRPEIDAYLAGRVDGYLEGEAVGYSRGWQACDDEISALQRAAHRFAQAAARCEPHVVVEARRRDAQVDLAERRAREARSWAREAS